MNGHDPAYGGSHIEDFTAGTLADSLAEAVLSGFVHGNDATDEPYAPLLIANHDGHTMRRAICDELESSERFDMSVAFVSQSALQSLKQHFLDFSEHAEPHAGRLFTSTYNYFNSPKVFRELLSLHRSTGIDVFIWQPRSTTMPSDLAARYPYHPKGYIFHHHVGEETLYSAYVGSSNLTHHALTTNREWNLRVTALRDGSLIHQINREIHEQLSDSVPLTETWIRRYEEDFQHYAPPRAFPPSQTPGPVTPNAMQREALHRLQILREQGESRALIISATGTGKTYLAAFDARQCKPKRLLYLAQQQMILTKSMKSYQRILGTDEHGFGLFSGDIKDHDADYLFATVQTMSKPEVLTTFARDHFDYILIDEVHHAAAPSYRRIIDYFTPSFMLGMTATPERTDGENIFSLFGNNIAYEIRLQQALEEHMLCPFHYYGVHEYIASSPPQDPSGTASVTRHGNPAHWSVRERSTLSRWFEALIDPERVRYIIDKIQVYSQAGTPVHGLVFCSRQDEARRLSELFNAQFNQQSERRYRTEAVTGQTPRTARDEAIAALERGDLDYIFTVDLFNEGIDIPAVNQIIMLRQTQSSIIFTQQLGRGLRKTPHKDCVVVIDFIGNYANNYLIPIALYGNTGDRDIARRNMQRETIGVTSISFDTIARDRILSSLDQADLSEMRLLGEQYRQLRYELGRIPMLMDFAATDPSLIVTLAAKSGDYLSFVRSRERSLSGGGQLGSSYSQHLGATTDVQNAILKMLTATQLSGSRPHELLVLAHLCAIPYAVGPSPLTHRRRASQTSSLERSITMGELANLARGFHPLIDVSDIQCSSALHALDLSYFTTGNRKRFGATPLVESDESGVWKLSEPLRDALTGNATFTQFFADTIEAGLFNCAMRYDEASQHDRQPRRGLIYGEKYGLYDVMRLCGWSHEQIPQNVGGYRLDIPTSSMPIFIKYETSQYQDRFTSPQDLIWFSKNRRSLHSTEYQWLLDGAADTSTWQNTHFVPIFIRRKQETKEGTYYYVGNAASITDVHEDRNHAEDGSSSPVVISTLHLDREIDPELFAHITGQPARSEHSAKRRMT